MGTNGQLFPLTDNTDGAAVDQVQQQHLKQCYYIITFYSLILIYTYQNLSLVYDNFLGSS
jgi:hypothetical protein